MRTYSYLVMAIVLTPLVAVAQPVSWHDYVVPESGAVAQIPAEKTAERPNRDMDVAFLLRIGVPT